jgi:hypothetical protein
MKSPKFLPLVILIVAAPMLFECGGSKNPEPSGPDQQLTKLSKTWKCTAATLDSQPQTGYTNMTLTISGTAGQATFNYTTTGRPALSPWAAAGTFTFDTTDFATSVKRDDGVQVTYSVTATQLQTAFAYSGAGIAGRVSNVKGQWSFTFTPQ